MPARVLVIAGSDSGGGAGIQGDIKTISALGGYAMTAITALTAQNTQGVFGIHDVPVDFISKQIGLCVSDIGVDAIKTGMLSTAEVIDAVADALKDVNAPLVVDPVMVAKGGAALLKEEAVATLKARLLPMATIVTPNIPEAELLTGRVITTPDEMASAARHLCDMGAKCALVKGGHLDTGKDVCNVLVGQDGVVVMTSPRLTSTSTHGTGCALASAIATYLGQGAGVQAAVEQANSYVAGAIAHAPGLGGGHGPLAHFWAHKLA